MRRRLFNLGVATSLALCLATAAAWVRSTGSQDSLRLQRYRGADPLQWRYWELTTNAGSIVLSRCEYITRDPVIALYAGDSESRGWHFWQKSWPYRMGGPGFSFITRHDRHGGGETFDGWWLGVPDWLLLLLFALPPVLQWLVPAWRRRRRRMRRGRCPTCGYDLRATPDRCRECGSVPAT